MCLVTLNRANRTYALQSELYKIMSDKITALIPTYRRPEHLRRAILSVLRQTHSHLQIAVFDNASGDNTAEVVRGLSLNEPRIKYHCQEKNIGALANFRCAFRSVETPYCAIMSDDDLVARDFYENAVNVLNNNPEVMFIIMNALTIDENLNLIGNRISTHKLTFYCDKDRFDALHSGGIPTTWTAMVFRKEVAQIYVEMDGRFDIGSDMRFLSHAAARYNFAYLSKVGAFFTNHLGSLSVSRPYINSIHYGVILSRYIEIFYDDNVDPYIRDRAAFYFRGMLSGGPYKGALIGVLKRFVKSCCDDIHYPHKMVEMDIESLRHEGYVKMSAILDFLYRNNLVKNAIFVLFGRYHNKLMDKHKSEMLKLQNGINKELFEDIKHIGCD